MLSTRDRRPEVVVDTEAASEPYICPEWLWLDVQSRRKHSDHLSVRRRTASEEANASARQDWEADGSDGIRE